MMTSEVKERKRKLLAWILSVALAVGSWQGNQLVAQAEEKTVTVYLKQSTAPDGVISSGESFAGYPGYQVTVETDAYGNYTVGPFAGNSGKNQVISWAAADSGGYAVASYAGTTLQVSGGDTFDQAFNDQYSSMGVLGEWGKHVDVNFYTQDETGASVLYDTQAFTQKATDDTFTVTLPEEPVKENYFFDGWNCSQGTDSVTSYTLRVADDETFPSDILQGDVSGISYISADGNELPDLLSYDYVAQWISPGTVTVTYKLDGGTLNGNESETYTQTSKNERERSVTLPDADPPEGSEGKLLKWQDQYGCVGYAPGESFTIYFDTGYDIEMPMTGVWVDPLTASVFFDLAEGTMTVEPETETIVQTSCNQLTYTVTMPEEIPAREGYIFDGWCEVSDDGTGTTLYSAKQDVEMSFNADPSPVFTAQWSEAMAATVSYNADGGTYNGTSPETIYQPTHDAAEYEIQVPDTKPVKDGYYFMGWFCSEKNQTYQPGSTISGLSYKEHPSVTLTAQWQLLQSAKITFNTVQGTLEGTPVSDYTQTTPEDKLKVILPKVSRSGYFFTGWQCDRDGNTYGAGEEAELSYNETADGTPVEVIFTAQWTAVKTATVEYDANGGSMTEDGNATKSAVQASPEETSFQVKVSSAEPTKDHAFFDYWEYSVDDVKQTGVTVSAGDNVTVNYGTEDVTTIKFTAVYTDALTATVSYDAGDEAYTGEVAETIYQPTRATQTYEIQVSKTEPTKTGYFFAGWLCSADDQIYQPGSTVSGLTYNEQSSVTLTAQWSVVKTATVNYDANGGSVAIDDNTTQSATQPDIATESFWVQTPTAEPTKEHAFFDYWEYSIDGEKQLEQVPAGGSVTVNYGAENVTIVKFTAVYTNALTATVTYEPAEGIYEGALMETVYQSAKDTKQYQIQVSQTKPVRDGYSFAGWLCSADGKTYQSGETISELDYGEVSRVILTAQWIIVPDTANNAPDDQPNDTDEQEENMDASPAEEPPVLLQSTVTLNLAGGSYAGATSFLKTQQNSGELLFTQVLPQEIPVKENAYFDGWLCSANAYVYGPGEELWFAYANVRNVVFTAQWVQEIGEGTVYLEKGVKYRLKSGVWTISGDVSVYPGNMNFYVAEDGYYTINKGE